MESALYDIEKLQELLNSAEKTLQNIKSSLHIAQIKDNKSKSCDNESCSCDLGFYCVVCQKVVCSACVGCSVEHSEYKYCPKCATQL